VKAHRYTRQPVSTPSTSFDQTFSDVSDVEGWMTEAQAHRLWDRASELSAPAQVVEIGSYQGRSAIVFGRSAPEGVEVVAIDPHAGNDRGPQQIHGQPDEGQADHVAFNANLEKAGVRDRIRHVRLPSQDALDAVEGDIDVLYIDGAHRYRPARDDIRDWGAKVRQGGVLLIHDSFSSVGVTAALITQLFTSADFRYDGRSGSMTEYRRQTLGGRDRVANALRQVAQLPWFARNVVIKVLIVARLGRLTRFLGHREPTWPY
jgi:predicted O-methyltransferase YrrM